MNHDAAMDDLLERIQGADSVRSCSDRAFVYDRRLVVIEFSTLRGPAAIDVEVRGGRYSVSVVARSRELARLFRGMLLLDFPLVQSGGERHYLFEAAHADEVVSRLPDVVATLRSRLIDYLKATPMPVSGPGRSFPVFWWDHTANFGDSIGPALVARMLNVRPVNSRLIARTGTVLYSVGSITAMIDQDNVAVWGSGLLKPLTDSEIMRLRSRREVDVLAVRGLYTELELKAKLGWNVPAVYGDPALLLPRVFPVLERKQGSISVVLHWEHVKFRQKIRAQHRDQIQFVDVDEDYLNVVQKIASSSVCISSSLHGIIVAQAYGVPWVWLQFNDHLLHSSNFKFDDFFTTIDRPRVCKKVVASERLDDLDWNALAESATLPELRADLDLLEGALRSRFN